MLKKHLFLAAGIAAFIALYLLGLYCTYAIPKQTIQQFYRILQEKKELQDAWALLDQNYQKVWESDPNRFVSGYRTTVAYADMRIVTQGHALDPFGFMFFNSLTFDVSFVVEDRFSQKDILDPIQQRSNAFWLRIAHSTDYARLVDGSLGFGTLPLRRRYKQVIDLRRISWRSWVITRIQNRECCLIVE
jgi:hypothetical protein